MKVTKWKPTCGERYYYISQSGTISSTRAGTGRDTIFRIATNNCFKTYDKCKNVLTKKLNQLGLPFFPWGTVGYCGINHNYLTPEKYIPHPNKW